MANPERGAFPPGEPVRDEYDPRRFLEEQYMRISWWPARKTERISDGDYTEHRKLPQEKDENRYRISWFNNLTGIVEGGLATGLFPEGEVRDRVQKDFEDLKWRLEKLQEEKASNTTEIDVPEDLVFFGSELFNFIGPYVVRLDISPDEEVREAN